MCCDRGPPFAAASRNCAGERLAVALRVLTGQGVRGRAGGYDRRAPRGGRGSLGDRQGHQGTFTETKTLVTLRCHANLLLRCFYVVG